MKLRLHLLLLGLALSPALQAQDVPQLMKKGQEAMDAHLWEVAIDHYESLLKHSGLNDEQRSNAAIRLAEALIRDGQADSALELLGQSRLQAHPETTFWRGQALAATGRFGQAVETLKSRISDPKQQHAIHRFESGLTASSLELALDQPREALKTLSLTAQELKGTELQRVRLRQIAILLDLDRIAEARELLPDKQQMDPSLQSEADFIEAAMLLRENRPSEAAARYQQLVDNPQDLTRRQLHQAWIGRADALLALGEVDEAAELLLEYIQKYPESTQLEEIFKRLIQALPEQPAPSDPILTRLQTWIQPADLPELGLVPNQQSLAVSAWPQQGTSSDLNAFSLFTRALGLRRQETDAARHEAEILLTRLRLEHPTHFLASRALLEKARWHLEDNEPEKARHLLLTLRETATSPLIKGQAAFLQAHAMAGRGIAPMKAGELFDQSAELLQGHQADTARFNGALIHLIQSDDIPAGEAPTIEDPSIAASLQLEKALAIADPTRRQIAIEAFLQEHPVHDRAAEARLNLAEAVLQTHPPDPSSAAAQIEALEADPTQHATLDPARIALVSVRIHDLNDEPEKAITSARTLLADFPSSDQAVEAAFILGRKLFETGNYNDARIVLEKLTTSLSDTQRIQTAWLMAARSAALIPTSQSRQEALALFDQAIALDGPLSDLARLERARVMINLSLLSEAVDYLRPWYEKMDADDPLRLGTGLLLAEAIYAQGKLNPDSLPQALNIYNELLKSCERHSPEHDRIQYLRGLTLEQLPDPELPDVKRDKEALIAYYSVIERDEPPAQWHYFEACGFKALGLLKDARRWPAAIACAKKIASFGGPNAAKAAEQAKQMQLKYMIWED
ncbi:MAG: tetratricopeptide repeat protein [Akkermansiaceae bacterium]|nr:tetratricopeptide repeat protein [Akkermansiaceae bacterium]